MIKYCLSQLPSLSPWSSKEGTVQTSSPSSVDTVTLVRPQCGYTMGQWRVVKSLPLPSLVQCTLFKLEQNTQQPLLELTMYELWMDMSSSVRMMIWAPSPRAMQSSTPSSLLVSLISLGCASVMWPHPNVLVYRSPGIAISCLEVELKHVHLEVCGWILTVNVVHVMCSVSSSCCVQSMLAESIWYSVPALVYMCVWFNAECPFY